jgi:hypothetical protein
MFKGIIILSVAICATSCGPAMKIKRAEKLINKAIAQGAKIDSSKYIRYDSVTVRAFRDAFKTTVEVSPTFFLEKCKELAAAKPKDVRPIILEVQKRVCPDIAIDTTYQLNIDSPEGIYKLPVHIMVNTKGGTADLSIEGGELIIPVKVSTSSVKISAGYTLWQVIICGLVGLFAGYGVRALFRK